MIEEKIRESARLMEKIALDVELCGIIKEVADVITDALTVGKKVLIAGNGGSASQAEHIAGEFVGKFYKERTALPCLSLTGPTACLTAVANDYGYKDVFTRQLEAFGNVGDVFIGITTSGKSKNILRAVDYCQKAGIVTVVLTGSNITSLHSMSDYSIVIPSNDTPRVQECHILIGHIIAELVEKAFT